VAGSVLALVGFSAALLPAWRAATVNPTDALRL
jgi:ABC-type lipoprotein release transport system permease subunit